MPYEARVIFVKTRPYTAEEMNALSHEEYGLVKHGKLEKPDVDIALGHIVTEDLEGLRAKVIEIAERTAPKPIVVITDAFPDSFLVGKQYHASNPNAIFEQILFTPNPDHPALIQEKEMMKQGRLRRKPPASEGVGSSEPKISSDDEMLDNMRQREAESLGMGSHEEFITYLKNSLVGAQKSGADQQGAIAKLQKDLMQKYYEHGGQGAYSEIENPKESLKHTTIQFRVISKKEDMAFSDCCRYYAKSHDIPIRWAITNSIPDMTVRWGYK